MVLRLSATKPSASKVRKSAKKGGGASTYEGQPGSEVLMMTQSSSPIGDQTVGTGDKRKALLLSEDKDKEEISKVVHVRVCGQLVPRSLAQLSGGERRRVALALALGFADLVRSRGRLSCNLLVLDEALQQLDAEGCSRVASVLRNLPHDSVLVVGQAHSYITQVFDVMDIVVKRAGGSRVQVVE